MVRIDMNNWLIEQQTKSPCNRWQQTTNTKT
jgi:hypothetical protein